MRAVLTLFLPPILVLASCASPPQPATVDESQKRPANSGVAVELQSCRNDLQNTRILAGESGRLAEVATATLERMSTRQQAAAAMQETRQANSVYTVRFEFGSTRVDMPADMAQALIDEARAAPLVLLRGRTDGAAESPAESRIARERAAAMRDVLVAAGIDPARIRSTWQPVGDHAADNSDSSGRRLNRRVEIEVYRALPVAIRPTATAATDTPPTP
jgi:outer membrane protein OmpA-like peptidoglycan-associated protein